MKQNIDTYLNHLAVERGFSGNTIMAYRNDLYSLHTHLESKGVSDWRNVSSNALAEYVLLLQGARVFGDDAGAQDGRGPLLLRLPGRRPASWRTAPPSS